MRLYLLQGHYRVAYCSQARYASQNPIEKKDKHNWYDIGS